MSKNFLDLLKEKVVVFDGAAGSNLQSQNLTIIEKNHARFLHVGCNLTETKSLGGEIYQKNILKETKRASLI